VKPKQLIKPKVRPPPTQGNSLIKEYFIEAYIISLGVSPNGEFAKEMVYQLKVKQKFQ